MAERWVKDGDIWKLGMWRIVPSASGGVHVYLGDCFKFFRGNVRKAKESVKRHIGFDGLTRAMTDGGREEHGES